MPAYVDTGFNVVAVDDVAEGHWLAAKRGRIGERYILGERNMTLKDFLGLVAAKAGCAVPRMRLPYAVALAAGYTENFICSMIGRNRGFRSKVRAWPSTKWSAVGQEEYAHWG